MTEAAQVEPKQAYADEYGVATAPDAVRLERLLPGPIERVWSYLTESEKRCTWLAAGEMDLLVGGRVEHVFRNSDLAERDDPPPKYSARAGETRMRGFITACEPHRLLGYTWGGTSGGVSEVCFELETRGDNVFLVLTHRRLATRDDMVSVAGGWHTHLGILCDRLSGRTPPAFWATHTRLEAEYDRRIPAQANYGSSDQLQGHAGPGSQSLLR